MSDDIQADMIVVGSGIAGLFFAQKIASTLPKYSVVVLTKNTPLESNTFYAQGGIAGVLDTNKDAFEKHINDTLEAGDSLCNREVVEMIVSSSPAAMNDLLNIGVEFDRDESGSFHLAKEGGHSESRIMHRKDQTGKELEEKLLFAVSLLPNVRLLPHIFAIDLIVDEQQNCTGLHALNMHNLLPVRCTSTAVILASGGAGRVYKHTTNPPVATGDGIAMAHRAGAMVKSMEFIQFHPTAFFHENADRVFLVSEAVRGAGAILRNDKGVAFMNGRHPLKDLAPRDVVSRAIHEEIEKNGMGCVFLDCNSIGNERFALLFPNIYKHCIAYGIVPGRDLIPVAPAAHYICGGIQTGMYGETSIRHLYACGECAYTGMHGANRLASNSLLEAVVFASRIADKIISERPIKKAYSLKLTEHVDKKNEENTESLITAIQEKLREKMSRDAGIVKRTENLRKLQQTVLLLKDKLNSINQNANPVLWNEVNNLLDVALLIVNQSLERKENRGVFYNLSLEKENLKIG